MASKTMALTGAGAGAGADARAGVSVSYTRDAIEREVLGMYEALEAEVPFNTALELTTRAICSVVSMRDDLVFVSKPFKTTELATELQCVIGEMITLIKADQRVEPEDIVIPVPGEEEDLVTQEVSVPYLMANGKEIQMSLKTEGEIIRLVADWMPCTYSAQATYAKYEAIMPIILDIVRTVISIDEGWGVQAAWWNATSSNSNNDAENADSDA